ncbi:MAG: DUF932 domain-containing protein [Candidatus Methanospirareceae archaeon]
MSHEITIHNDGTAEAAFALKPAWHGLGTVLDHPMTSEEAMREAHLDWTVKQLPVAVGHSPVDDHRESSIIWKRDKNLLCNVRSDNGFRLGCVTTQYQIVQNTEAFAFLDALLEEGELVYESAFSLRGGKQVVLLARMPETDEVVPGDTLLRYILLSTSHDGTGSVQFGPTSVRVVCANTYSIALSKRTTSSLSIQHKGNVMDKLERAREILGGVSSSFARYSHLCQSLCEKKLSMEEWEQFLDMNCPLLDRLDPDWTPAREKRLLLTRESIAECFRNPRQSIEGMEETAWAAYNAVSEHIDHLPRRGRNAAKKAEARFNTTISGVGMTMKQRAMTIACRMAGVEMAL